MMWDIEERVEDTLVAYLQRTITGEMRVYSGFGAEETQYPCVVVHVASSSPVSDLAEWHDQRRMVALVAVRTEMAAEVDTSGVVVHSPRERNAVARSDVMSAIAKDDLAALLAEVGTAGVQFSMAQVAGVERSVDDNVLVSVITVEMIAEPVEVS